MLGRLGEEKVIFKIIYKSKFTQKKDTQKRTNVTNKSLKNKTKILNQKKKLIQTDIKKFQIKRSKI